MVKQSFTKRFWNINNLIVPIIVSILLILEIFALGICTIIYLNPFLRSILLIGITTLVIMWLLIVLIFLIGVFFRAMRCGLR